MLSILIPTYNRVDFLIKNINLLVDIINKADLQSYVQIIVSDNFSNDNTCIEIQKLINLNNIKITYYKQKYNIGLQQNALYTLKVAQTKYVMYIGDDDFISLPYLAECIKLIKSNPDTQAIIPNYIPISVDGEVLATSRSLIGPTLKFTSGYASALENSWKGHQLSGLVFSREGLLEQYNKNGVNNIYPFIFFLAHSCLQGTVYAVGQFPVLVTQPIKSKDWGYNKDGLINEIFDNYKKLPIAYLQRFGLEKQILIQQPWRLLMYIPKGNKIFIIALFRIACASNSSLLFTLSFPFLLLLIKLKLRLK